MSQGRGRGLRSIARLGWLCFGVGILAFIYLFLRYGTSSIPKTRWRSQWGQPHWVTFRDPAGKFLIDHSSDWDESAPFERFTRHQVGDLMAMDTVAIRRGKPIGLLILIRYVAPAARPPAEWLRQTRLNQALKHEFGLGVRTRDPGVLGGVAGLHMAGEDMVADVRYHLESWFIPAGVNAYRLTIAAPQTDFPRVEPILRRMVASFRFVEQKKASRDMTLSESRPPAEN